jgi:N utilization substance protein A
VAAGAVVLKEIAREAGGRSKIAVFSNQPGVDPVGSCVGQKGVRVQAVINEIGGMEKVDIIQWNEDPKLFIQSALSPAKDIEVILDEKKKTAEALISSDQLSLAIGKDGQNVRLAGKLTGWRIDIKPKETTSITSAVPSGKTKTVKKTKKTEEKKEKKE